MEIGAITFNAETAKPAEKNSWVCREKLSLTGGKVSEPPTCFGHRETMSAGRSK